MEPACSGAGEPVQGGDQSRIGNDRLAADKKQIAWFQVPVRQPGIVEGGDSGSNFRLFVVLWKNTLKFRH